MSSAPGQTNVQALLDRADALAPEDARAAMTFYQAALQTAQANPPADPQIVERLRSAQAFIAGRAREFEQSLDQALAGFAPDNVQGGLRLTHALEMLKGTRTIYPQEPSVFYYPYLSQRQFFEREEFEWVPALEAAAPAIRAELLALVEDGADFQPYVVDEPNRPHRQFAHLNNDRSWSALYLWHDAKLVEEVARRCPNTVAALERVPLTHIGARTPSVLFSRLEPGAHIPPHAGMLNCRLIGHLPLIVPPGCTLRVGNETREWEQGKMLIFDDSIEHEARNPTGELRVVLLFDLWRPELSPAEQTAISNIFSAIDQFQTLPDA